MPETDDQAPGVRWHSLEGLPRGGQRTSLRAG